MVELYNTTGFDNVTNILDIATEIGLAMGSDFIIGNLILLTFFTVFLILGFKHDWIEVLIIDSFLTTYISILLYFAGMVQVSIIVIPLVMFMVCMVFYFTSR